jgi:hypothetical protein
MPLLPSSTPPKFSVAGDTVICDPVLPFPVSETGNKELVALLKIETLPSADPLNIGENSIPRVTLSPGESSIGSGGIEPSWKPGPLTVMFETVTFEPSLAVLLTATVLDPVCPTGTAPN